MPKAEEYKDIFSAVSDAMIHMVDDANRDVEKFLRLHIRPEDISNIRCTIQCHQYQNIQEKYEMAATVYNMMVPFNFSDMTSCGRIVFVRSGINPNNPVVVSAPQFSAPGRCPAIPLLQFGCRAVDLIGEHFDYNTLEWLENVAFRHNSILHIVDKLSWYEADVCLGDYGRIPVSMRDLLRDPEEGMSRMDFSIMMDQLRRNFEPRNA